MRAIPSLCRGVSQRDLTTALCGARSFRRRFFAKVTCFDIVAIEVEHECGVVIVAVLASKPRRPIILRDSLERRGMELVHSVFA